MSELRDRNTAAMVAKHWGCSLRTVQRRIADGSLHCLRIGGIVRVSREQVEAYERACTYSSTQTASGTLDTGRGGVDGFLRERGIAVPLGLRQKTKP
jgi:excisionase family DNA binding protein